MAATDTDSLHDNMTRLRMRMIQQKIANERDKLQRPDSESSNDYDAQVKLQHAMLKRQTLLDKIRQEQLLNDESRRPRTYSPRRRYTPSPLPPPSRRSLPDLSRNYNVYLGRDRDMAQVKHVIEHKFKSDPTPRYQLPPIQTQAVLPSVSYQQPVITQQISPAVATINAVPTLALQNQGSDRWFKKEDFMDMMMMQNAQMHHMVMQQLMVNNLPGNPRPAYYAGAEAVVPVRAAPTVYHHHTSAPAAVPAMHHYQALPPLDMGGYGRGRRIRGTAPIIPDAKQKTALSGGNIARDKRNKGNRPSSVFLFGIILKEIVAALHRIYLNPNGNIYPIMQDAIGPNVYDFSILVQGQGRGRLGEREAAPLLQTLQYVVENLTYHITEIMPKTGVLGTHRKAAVYELIKENKRFPDGYFWQVELDRLMFAENGRTANIGGNEAFLLLVGIFVSRSLITTLLLKPVDYGLSTNPLTDVAERNLRVLASVMLFIVRRGSVPRGQPMMPIPGEIARYVYNDEELRPLHMRMRRTYDYCEQLLREWGAEYIRRLRAAATDTTTGTVQTSR